MIKTKKKAIKFNLRRINKLNKNIYKKKRNRILTKIIMDNRIINWQMIIVKIKKLTLDK